MAKLKEKKKKSKVDEEDDESTMKRCKRNKDKEVTMTMQTISENPNKISPIVAYFPSGYNPLKNNNKNSEKEPETAATTKLYGNVKRNNRLQLVVSPNVELVDFVGTNYSGEATSAQLCTYSLGVLEKDTRTLNIVPIAANKIIRLEPRVREQEVPENEDPVMLKEELTAEQRTGKLRTLTEKYSSKKSVRQAKKLDSLRQQDTGNEEEFDRSIARQINQEALQVAATADSAWNLPPHDLAATAPQLAYPLDRIIFSGDWDDLLDILELSNAGAELTTDLYPSFVCNRSYKLKRLQGEEEKKRLAGIFQYITYLVRFKDKHSMDGVSSAKHQKIPGFLFQRFSSLFAISDSKRLPDEKRDLLISYVLVLSLFADDFRSDPSDIARDLRINSIALRPHFEYLGCKLVREKNVLLAILPVPLNFPTIRRKRKR